MAQDTEKVAEASTTSSSEQQPPAPAKAQSVAPAAASAAATKEEVEEEAPDPDEDDLDELDDMLDEFSSLKTDAAKTTTGPSSSGPGRPREGSGGEGAADGVGVSPEEAAEEFTAALQREMASLMGEIDKSPEMQQQLDAMMRDLSAGIEAADSQKGGGESSASAEATTEAMEKAAAKMVAPPGAPEDAFQEKIRKTMERMQASGEQAGAAAASAGSGGGTGGEEQDMLEQLLKEMGGATGAGGEGGEEEFSKMLLGMMEQLTNKEILYEPMKDLQTKFPDWMKENRDKTPKADLDRYLEQEKLVNEIVARFERSGYSDNNAADREYIVERMQQMQAAGSPPADLVGDMKETQEALGDLDAGCPQQ